MDGNAKNESGNTDISPAKSTEKAADFIVVDELKQPNNNEVVEDGLNNLSAEKDPAVEVSGTANKDASTVQDTVKEEAPIVQDHEKNGDSLILTADEDLEPAISSPKKPAAESAPTEGNECKQTKADVAVPNATNAEPTGDAKTPAEKVPVSKMQRVIWVSNISKTIKATDLKQHLSKAGKVTTTKIVTDGKRCFGYVLMENAHDASECVKTLNNTSFDNKNIVLSFDKPIKNRPPTKTNIPASDAKKSTEENSQRQHASDTGRTPKRHRSSSNTSAEKNKGGAEEKIKSEASSDPSKPAEKKRRSRSVSRDRYLRDRLKQRMLIEARKSREARKREHELEQRYREKDFRLEQERRKLQMERDIFEKQKREWTRINDERRKLERERLEIEMQRTKLDEDLKKERMKRRSPDVLPSVLSKISDPSKKGSRIIKRNDFKHSYDNLVPPSKMGMGFDHGGRKPNEIKMVRAGGRKIEVVERKFYGDSTDHKKHYNRKPEFEDNKTYMKRYPSGREEEHRTQWSSTVGYGSGVGSSAPRYEESTSQQFGGGPPSRPSYFYQPSAATQEFQRYDPVSNRKY